MRQGEWKRGCLWAGSKTDEDEQVKRSEVKEDLEGLEKEFRLDPIGKEEPFHVLEQGEY